MKMTQSPYLHDIPLDQAVKLFHKELETTGLLHILATEEIPLTSEASGRILVEPVIAAHCSPHYHASAMDGFAVRSLDTIGAQPASPISIKIGKSANYVDTGDPLPDWADAVIPIENVESVDDEGRLMEDGAIRNPCAIRIRASVSAWSHVRPVGEDLIEGQLILPAGEQLRPVDLGAIAAGGVRKLRVAKKPVVGILPTGDELISLDREPQKGELSEFNSLVIAAQISQWGGVPRCYPITKDILPLLIENISEAAKECDLILVNAGSSAGKEDFTARAIDRLGEVIVHGIAVRPGHPVILGFIDASEGETHRKVPIVGVPGYPVSAAMTTEIIVKPLLNIWLGSLNPVDEGVIATLTRKLTSPAGDDDYVRVILGIVNDKILAAPISRGAGVTTSLSQADGMLIIPRMVQGIEAGEKVNVHLLRGMERVRQNLLTIGSHDLTLDLLAQHLSRFNRRLVSSNAGSMGGLVALLKGETHFAGSHLLDPLTGTYNTTDIHRLMPGKQVTILSWVTREQGLMVKVGNPKKITSLTDLLRPDVTFVNRQRGAGTRVLLDFQLGKLGIIPQLIKGYSQEEYTHLGVAVAIASGRADCGLGVAAAAESMGLDFVSIAEEEYELVFAEDAQTDPFLKPVFQLAVDLRFQAKVMELPGYKVVHMGEIRKYPSD
jgi:putative molybdopterin biosynthesis protein